MRRLLVISVLLLVGAGCVKPAVIPSTLAPLSETPTSTTQADQKLNYETVEITPEFVKKYANNNAAADSISTIPQETSTRAYDFIKQPKIKNLLEKLAQTDAPELEFSFGVSTPSLQYVYNNKAEATVFKGCMPHNCGQSATAIYIPDYTDEFHLAPTDELFVAFQIGHEIRLYNVSENGKSELKDSLLYFALSDWRKIKTYDPIDKTTQNYGGSANP